MEPQTFRAASTQLALERVQEELGPDAIILSVRQVPTGPAWQTWKQPDIEVLAVASLTHPNDFVQTNSPFKPTSTSGEKNSASIIGTQITDNKFFKPDDSLATPSELETYLATLTSKIAQSNISHRAVEKQPVPQNPQITTSSAHHRGAGIPNGLVKIKQLLEKQGLDRELIKKLLTSSGESLNPVILEDEVRLRKYLRHQLEVYIPPCKNKLLNMSGKQVICLIGTSGSGKTSTCAKLIAIYKKEQSKTTAWISTDTVRTGAITQAKAFTETLAVPFHLAYTPDDLRQALQHEKDTEIIIIDTPARNPYIPNEVIELGEYLTLIPERKTYVTFPATTKESDLHETIAAFHPYKINGLILTKLDETRHYGNIINQVWRNRVELSAYTDGTGVLNNIHPISPNHLSGLIFGEEF